MRVAVLTAWTTLIVAGSLTAWSQDTILDPDDFQNLLRLLETTASTEAPVIVQDENGFVTFIGAPPDGQIATPTSLAKSIAIPESVARGFLLTHRGALGATSPRHDFQMSRMRSRGDHTYVHLKQTYGGLEVFGAAAMVQVNGDGGVDAALSDIMRQTQRLDTGEVSLTATLPAAEAQSAAVAFLIELHEEGVDGATATDPELVIYRPAVVGESGATRLTWKVEASGISGSMPVRELMLVDAHSGQVVFHYSLIKDVKDRRIYDAAGAFIIRRALIRQEDGPLTGIQDADDAYDQLGDTYDFYLENHARDGLDGIGSPLHATVNFGTNFFNAFWDGRDMVFGQGFVVDDVTAHELTHGVTDFESGLIFFGESGAINESFSDIWGEFVDLVNGRGNDSPQARWFIGEEVPFFGPIRFMKDPTIFTWFPFDREREFTTPDRYNHPDFYRGFDDAGGVHFNSGVGNKLCYLLTDGDFFNGILVGGMGIPLVADLFYEAQLMLGPSSNYFDLGSVLQQAAINLSLTPNQRANVLRATNAVEITVSPFAERIQGVRAIPTRDSAGRPLITLQWKHPAGAPLEVSSIVRKAGSYPTFLGDGDQLDLFFVDFAAFGVQGIVDGLRDSLVVGDGSLQAGVDYFYLIVANTGVFYAHAVAGADPPDFVSEAFVAFTGTAIDLASSQILFSPVLDVDAAQASGRPEDFVNYTNYTSTITTNIDRFPVARIDANGAAILLIMPDDGAIIIPPRPVHFPYFGRLYNTFTIAANGYIGLGNICLSCSDNFPSLQAHGDNRRISFLFSDLLALSGGQIWFRELEDRFVITFEGVPERIPEAPSQVNPNSVQVELFFSGHVRFTYLDVNVRNAIVGLSDGKGVPSTLRLLVPDTVADVRSSDLSRLPGGNPQALIIWPPIPAQVVIEGETVRFDVQTISPNEVPSLTANWDRPGAPPFSDNGDGTGTFIWITDPVSSGVTNVEIRAFTLNGEVASQVVQILVANLNAAPEARNLALSAGIAGEDPTRDREVPVSAALRALYVYFHPEQDIDPITSAEGNTEIRWFRNGASVAAFQDVLQVPSTATKPGEIWSFSVLPRTVVGVAGPLVVSPKVTIGVSPVIEIISPNVGSILGGTVVRIAGSLLTSPLSVLFNGVPGAQLISLGDEELEVIAPAGTLGPATVTVTTISGSTTVSGLFSYGATASAKAQADVNGDGVVDAADVQLVIMAVLERQKGIAADTNGDGQISVLDVQAVVNVALAP